MTIHSPLAPSTAPTLAQRGILAGPAAHADTNALLNAHLARRGTLVVAHRGTGVASIVENTLAAGRASLASGADVVEIDLTESADGEWFAFHDGEEPRLLGIAENLRTLDAAQIRAQSYIHVARPDRIARVEPLLDVLGGLAGVAGARESVVPGPESDVPLAPLVNLDRSWGSWAALLPALDDLGMTGQILLKCPASERAAIDVLRAHPTKHPFLPICRTADEVEQIAALDGLDMVGVELLTSSMDHPFADPDYIASLHDRGLCVLINAERLPNDKMLFGVHDDEVALLEGPGRGWDPMLDLGADLVQTDWPWLLAAHRERRRGQRS